MAHSKTYVGSSSGWGYKRVDFVNTGGYQLSPGDSGKIIVVDADMAADAAATIYLPLLADVDMGYTLKFIIDASTSNDLNIAHHSSDSASIYGNVASADGSGGESSDGTAQAEVSFTSNCVLGDMCELTKVGNGTTSWWQLDGLQSDNNHMTIAT
jgi:hypothetical protein